jgi:hypothetical protein
MKKEILIQITKKRTDHIITIPTIDYDLLLFLKL